MQAFKTHIYNKHILWLNIHWIIGHIDKQTALKMLVC